MYYMYSFIKPSLKIINKSIKFYTNRPCISLLPIFQSNFYFSFYCKHIENAFSFSVKKKKKKKTTDIRNTFSRKKVIDHIISLVQATDKAT